MNEHSSNTNSTSTTSNTQRPARRKRPHPARTARRAVGAAGVGGMLLMTGFMALNTAAGTTAAAPAASAAATATGTATAAGATTNKLTGATTASTTAATPAPPVTGPAAGPPARAPVNLTVPQRLVLAFGRSWDIYPWVALILHGLSIVGLVVPLGGPEQLRQVLLTLAPLLWLGAMFWLVVDVLAERATIWWLIGFFFLPFFAPVILLFYLLQRS